MQWNWTKLDIEKRYAIFLTLMIFITLYLDHNWTFHGRLDEAEMEQLFYFVLLQKTLRSCLAVMNVPALRQFDGKMDYEVR